MNVQDPNDQREINKRLALQYLPPPPPERAIGPIFGGFICGIIVTLMSGCFALNFVMQHPTPNPSHLPSLPFWIYLAALAGAIIGVVTLLRSPYRKWFWVGALIGIGLTSLCEGLCFFNA